MKPAIFLIILLAAALHAAWNAIVKGGRDTVMTTVLVTGSAALIATAALPFLPPPAPQSWPFLAASGALSVSYYVLVARSYRVADMSQVYPLMRGTAPLIVAAASTVLLKERLSAPAWLGIVVICAGILSMIAGRGLRKNKGVAFALLNAVVIAFYTLIDGIGVRKSGSPLAYTLWIFLLTGAPLLGWALTRRAAAFRSYAADNWLPGMMGGVGTIASYGLALWAMTQAPIAVVAALRETAILFGTAISILFLRERPDRSRILAACSIAAGVAILRAA